MSPCLVCGAAPSRARIIDPGAAPRVAMVDASALARVVSSAGTFDADALLDLLARSARFIRCARCGALTRIGDVAESWVPGPVDAPTSSPRRAHVLPHRRREFEEVWCGARVHVEIPSELDVLVGDVARIVETYDDAQRDPRDAPRYVLGQVGSIGEHRGVVIASLRVLERGLEDRTIETRRARMIAALDDSGAHVASAAVTLGISVAEAYNWIHELGLEEKIRRYKVRTRRTRGGQHGSK